MKMFNGRGGVGPQRTQMHHPWSSQAAGVHGSEFILMKVEPA